MVVRPHASSLDFRGVGAWQTLGMPDERSYSQRAQDRRNEQSLKASADAAKKTAKRVDEMVKLTDAQVELAKAARADAEQSERFTRIMAWASLGVSIASLGAAIVAVVVSR